MATITGFTAEFIQAVLDGTIEDAAVDVNGDLIFTRKDGTTFNAGSVEGPQGDEGPAGPTSIEIVTSVTRPASPAEGLYIHETDTDRLWGWNGALWQYIAGGTDPVAARMFRAAAKNLTPVGDFVIVNFDSETYDYGNNASTATGRYTSPINGRLFVTAHSVVTSPGAGERFIGAIFLNGAEWERGDDITPGAINRTQITATSIVPVTIGDVVDFRISQINGTVRSLEVASYATYMSVARA